MKAEAGASVRGEQTRTKRKHYAGFRRDQLGNVAVRKEYEAYQQELALARTVLELRRPKDLTQKQLAKEMGRLNRRSRE